MKTLMLFSEVGDSPLGISDRYFFAVFEGDFSAFDGVYVNGTTTGLESRLADMLWDDNGDYIGPEKMRKPPREYDVFIDCGFVH